MKRPALTRALPPAFAIAGVWFAVRETGASFAQEPKWGTVSTVQAPEKHQLRSILSADVNRDGRNDLVLCTRREGKRAVRSLRVHLARQPDGSFDPEPDATIDLLEDVVAFAAADVDSEPGCEVLLFTSQSVWAWRTGATDERRQLKILATNFLWQIPDPRDALPWQQAVRDLNDDGLADLVVPEPDGYRIAIQRRENGVASFLPVSVLAVPEDEAGDDTEPAGARRLRARAERKRIKVSIQLGDGAAEETSDLVAVAESVPAPQFLDFDGDRRIDVLAQTPSRLHVWRQREDGTFPAAPDSSYEVPVVADRQRRLDVSYSALAGDLDGDSRADCVVFAGDKRSSDTRTQVLVFSQGGADKTPASPLFGAEGLPGQFLKIAGFAGAPRLVDVDGDGALDLTCGAVEVDGLDALALAAKGSIDAELYVFLNRKGQFSKSPDLTQTLSFRAESFRRGREAMLARFVGDVTGDGVRELLVRDEPTRLRLLQVKKRGEQLSVVSEPLWETVISEDARVVVVEGKGAAAAALIVEDDQVRHVRWP